MRILSAGLLVCALTHVANASSHLDSVMATMEEENPGSVDWFIEWGQEEDILDMYRDVVLGRRSVGEAIVHGHRFEPLASGTYVGLLYYYYPNISAQCIQEIFTQSHFRALIPRALTIKEIAHQLRVYVGLTSLPSRIVRTIFDNRNEQTLHIASLVKYQFDQAVKFDVSVGKVAIMVSIWNTLCVSDLAVHGKSDSCFYDKSRDRWWLIGPGRAAILRALILGIIQRN